MNHFDVAPAYGDAELRIRSWMKDHRDEIFLGCKTTKRTRKSAAEELRKSLERTGAKYFDLYQLHAVDEIDELETALGSYGALQAILEARKNGIIKHIGITSHRPLTLLEALKLFDFDTVMLPVNFVLKKHYDIRSDYEPILRMVKERDVGVIAMKSFAKQPYKTETHPHPPNYEPFDNQEDIEKCINFVLSQNVATVASASSMKLMPKMLLAAERYHKLTEIEQAKIIESAANLTPIFPDGVFMDQLIAWRKSRVDF